MNISTSHKIAMRVFIITNLRDKVIQKAMFIVLEMIYEKKGCFQDESHGFRPDKGFHTALQHIKNN